MKNSAVLACIALLSPLPTCAGWYLGLAGGLARVEAVPLEKGYPTEGLTRLQLRTVTATRWDSKGHAWKLVFGWQARPWLGIEGSYSDYGDQRTGFTGILRTLGGPPLFSRQDESYEATRRTTAWGIDGVLRWPLHERFDVLASAGVARARVRLDSHGMRSVGLGPIPVEDFPRASDTAGRLAVGAAWKPASEWSVRLTYEYLGKTGTEYAGKEGSELIDASDRHTGRSSQRAAWLGVTRSF